MEPTLFRRSRFSVKALRACAIFAAAALQPAFATLTWNNIQFGGFFSQGYLESTNNNFPVDTKDGTFDFREMGLNASTTIGAHLRLGGQVFARKLGKFGEDKPFLDWGLIDYNFRPEIGVRLGRIKYPRSLYSDALDLDVVRPFIFLPQAIYDPRLREFQASFDGAMIYGSISLGENAIDYKIFCGDVPMKSDSGVADYFNAGAGLFANPPGLQKIGVDSVRGIALLWNTRVPGLRFGLSYSRLSNLIASGPFIAVPSLTSSIVVEKSDSAGVSVEYTAGAWTLSSEWLSLKSDVLVLLPSFIAPPTRVAFGARSYYVSIARRLGAKFEAGTYFTEIRETHLTARTPSARGRKDLAVALRYDFNEHLLFKIEAHAIRGTKDMFDVPGISNPPGAIQDSMRLFAVKTTFSF